MALSLISALFVLVGCPGDEGKCDSGICDSGEADADADADTDADTDVSFTPTWVTTGVTLAINNGTGIYSFGLAEESGGGWYGEDCVAGPGPNSGSTDICHDDVSATGITLTTVHAIADVVANSTTLITVTIANGGSLATMLGDAATGDCWEQNDLTDYYACQ